LSQTRRFFLFLAPVILSVLLHWRIFSLDVLGVHVWRQAQTQTVIYNFAKHDNNIFHPKKLDLSDGSDLLLYEFPLYQWIVAQADRLVGYSVFNSRWVTFLVFVTFLYGFYKISRRYLQVRESLMLNFLLCFSPLLFYYCINPMPDLFALAASIWSVFWYFRFRDTARNLYFLLSCLFLMVATLVKLPYVLFGAVMLAPIADAFKERKFRAALKTLLVPLLFLLFPISWYLRAIPTWEGNDITTGIFSNNKSLFELFDILQSHIISYGPELLTNYASVIPFVVGAWLIARSFKEVFISYREWVFVSLAFTAYFFFEMHMIEKTHDYYLLPFVPLIFLVVGKGLTFILRTRFRWLVWVMLAACPVIAFFRIDHRWDEIDPGFPADLLNDKNVLHKLIPEGEKCIVNFDDSRSIVLFNLERQGFTFRNYEYSEDRFGEWVNKGAKYFVCTDPAFDLSSLRNWQLTEIYKKKVRVFLVCKK
jgi:hypothetical protein